MTDLEERILAAKTLKELEVLWTEAQPGLKTVKPGAKAGLFARKEEMKRKLK